MPKSALSRISHWLNVRVNQRTLQPLLFLVAIDVVFMVAHFLLKTTSFVTAAEFDIAQDRSYSEFFQYAKTLALSALLGVLSYQKRSLVYSLWSFIFLFIFIDDAFEVHEQLGAFFVNQLELIPALNLRAQDLGEMIVYAIYGVTILGAGLVAHYFDRDRLVRRTSIQIFSMLILLGVFGGVVDFLHVLAVSFGLPKVVVGLFTLAEDGGEMVVISVLLWFVGLVTFQRLVPPLTVPSVSRTTVTK